MYPQSYPSCNLKIWYILCCSLRHSAIVDKWQSIRQDRLPSLQLIQTNNHSTLSKQCYIKLDIKLYKLLYLALYLALCSTACCVSWIQLKTSLIGTIANLYTTQNLLSITFTCLHIGHVINWSIMDCVCMCCLTCLL